MSIIDDAFSLERVSSDLPIDHHPNWNGDVYGVCRTKGTVEMLRGVVVERFPRKGLDNGLKKIIAQIGI